MMLGLVTEYDKKFSDKQLGEIEDRWNPKYRPNRLGTTFSGGARLYWKFPRPVIINGDDHYKRIMRVLDEYIGFSGLLPFMDKGIFKSNLYYEACDLWVDIHDDPLSENLLEFVEGRAKDEHKDFKDLPTIDLQVVYKEVESRWPGRWDGDFELNARGCRFWDDDTWDQGTPNSAIVLEKGMYNHSERGGAGLHSWSEIFGERWLDSVMAEKFGSVCKDFFFDGRNYYRDMNDGTQWVPFNAQAVQRHLKVDYGLDGKTKLNEESEVSKVMTLIEKNKFVDGVVPFCNNPEKVVYVNGLKYLNNGKCTCVDPAEEYVTEEDFPFILEYLEKLFVSEKQFMTILAWMKRFYMSHYSGTPEMGQVLILAGPAKCGKTLFMLKILGGLVGSVANAKSWLMDGNQFNAELVSCALWTCDDEDGVGDYRSRSKLAAQLKKVASSVMVKYNQKYGSTADIPWYGRLGIACNLDDQSLLSMLPNLSQSIRDKLIACKVADGMNFPNSRHETEATITHELPRFARFLMDLNVDDYMTDSRFGVTEYMHPDLAVAAEQNSEGYGFQEVIDAFKSSNSNKPWAGTATQLHQELAGLELDKLLGVRINNTQIGRNLMGLIQTGYPGISVHTSNHRREFRIE